MTARIRERTGGKSKLHVIPLVLLAILIFFVAWIAFEVKAGIALGDSYLEDLPDYTNSDEYLVAEPTTIEDADGNVIATLYLQNRHNVTYDDVSPYVFAATVDTEDVRFYEHNGVDIIGIARAVLVLLQGGHEGASTITQQLVRNTVLSDEQFEDTIRRKVREAYIAIQLEKVYSKDEILMMYCNTIYYGEGSYGIEAASQTYFGVSAKDLSLDQAALLAGLPQSPSYLDPVINPEGAVTRRNLVLNRMLTNGDITQAEYDDASNQPLVLNYTSLDDTFSTKYPYFVDYVKQTLSSEYSTETLFKGGLTVKTTIVPADQEAAEQAVNDQLALSQDDSLDAALVSVDPDTGNVVAMVGGRDYDSDQFNLATQAKRQPGSSFKTFALVASIENGMNPSTIVNCSSPQQITSQWLVQNYANANEGIVPVSTAFALSSNTGFAQIEQKIGYDSIINTAHKMGITSDLAQVDAIVLGVSGVAPIEMANAYATIASGGIYRPATPITQIEDRDGNVIYEHEDEGTQVLDPSVAKAAESVMEGVLNFGTASGHKADIDQPQAGKTGTSENDRDLWFVGYTPQISTAVWVGYRQEAQVYWNGGRGYTTTTSVPIWQNYMTSILSGLPREEFPMSNASAPAYKTNTSWGFYVPPVDISGLSLEEIMSQYNTNYDIVITETYSDEVAEGNVISASVNSNTMQVSVTVSKGVDPTTTESTTESTTETPDDDESTTEQPTGPSSDDDSESTQDPTPSVDPPDDGDNSSDEDEAPTPAPPSGNDAADSNDNTASTEA